MEKYSDKFENDLESALKQAVSNIEPSKNLLVGILEHTTLPVTTVSGVRYTYQEGGIGRFSHQFKDLINNTKEFMTSKIKMFSAIALAIAVVGIGALSYINKEAPMAQPQREVSGNPDDIYNALVSDSMAEEVIVHDYNGESEEFSSNDQNINELDNIYDENRF